MFVLRLVLPQMTRTRKSDHFDCRCIRVKFIMLTFIRLASPLLSAGVGRTGMYIVMETALAMMNKLEPVYPLEIVQNVRDQRPMVIQTSVRFLARMLGAFDACHKSSRYSLGVCLSLCQCMYLSVCLSVRLQVEK